MSKFVSILDSYPDYAINIGIEVHVQLNTNTKIFCLCANKIAKEPNVHICQVCTGHLGALPVLNKEVASRAIELGLATNCSITPVSEFARKHYFYPDLPKGYQITQNDRPICQEGFIPIRLEDGTEKKIRLIRIHIEEDAGKNVHAGGESFVDLNRAGTPLLECVSYPDITSTYEARAYLKALHAIVRFLGICSGNMEEGAFRADTNISVRKKDSATMGTRVELKNINSFKFIADAIEHEIQRHIELIEDGGKIKQETRLWDTKEHKSVPMRSKEEAADYRYFPDPDLPLLAVDDAWIASIKKQMPELPYHKFNRFCTEFGLTPYEAEILTDEQDLALYFEDTIKIVRSKSVANWILRDVMGHLKEEKISLAEFKVTPEKLAAIIKLVEDEVINNRAAKEIFEEVAKTGAQPADVVKEKGLNQVGSVDELEAIIKQLLAESAAQVAEYKASEKKERLFGFFVGLAMKKTAGKGNPKVIQDLLKIHLS